MIFSKELGVSKFIHTITISERRGHEQRKKRENYNYNRISKIKVNKNKYLICALELTR